MRRVVLLIALVSTVLPVAAVAIPEGPEDETPEWLPRELANYLKTREEANRQFADPAFQLRLAEQSLANSTASREFQAEHGFINRGNLCYHWSETCAGDPWRYPGVDPFYDEAGGFTEVLFFDRDCARISGRVWAPLDAEPGDDLPGVVITNGSVHAPEPLYWWAAQALVQAGYVAMTYDPRGQGRSDTQTPDGTPGGNANPEVFWNGTVDAIDMFHSTPEQPYPHNKTCSGSVPVEYALAAAAEYNPHHAVLDRSRLGLAGHSLGATGATTVQAMDPWEGMIGDENPVDVIVAWDSLRGDFTPRVPAMGQRSEYGLVNVPFASSPDPEGHKAAFPAWEEAGQPVMQFTIQGSTHYEWSLIPSRPVANFSSTSWVDWGRPMAEHHTVAWFDRWLKLPHEPGYDDADARLLDDAQFCERFSFYFRSARNFPDRAGTQHVDGDIRASCLGDGASPSDPGPGSSAGQGVEGGADPGDLPATGGGLGLFVLLVALLGAGTTRRRRSILRM